MSVHVSRLFPVFVIVNVSVFDVPTVSVPNARLPLSPMIRVGVAVGAGVGAGVEEVPVLVVLWGVEVGATVAVGRGVGLNTFAPPESHPTRNRATPASATPRSVEGTIPVGLRLSRWVVMVCAPCGSVSAAVLFCLVVIVCAPCNVCGSSAVDDAV